MVTRRRRFLPGLCAVLMAAAGISWAQTRAPQATDVAGLVAEVRVADKLRKLDILAQLHAAIRSNGVGLDVVRAAAPSLAHDEARARLSSVSLISMAAGNARGPGDEAVRREAFRLLAAHVKTEPAHRVRKLIAHALPRTRVAQAVSILTDMSLEPNYEVAHTALAALVQAS